MVVVRSPSLPSSDEIWIDLWNRIESQIALAGGLRGDWRKPPREGEYIPAVPKRPNTLSGGAAAALEFDD